MPDDNSTGASFGVFPQMKPTRSLQDPEASKDMPVQLVRGAVKTGLGMVPDIAQTALDIAGNDTKLPLTSDWWEQKLPLKATSPEGRFASTIGEYSPFNPLMEAVPKAIGKGASIAGQGLSEAMMGQGPDWLKAMVPQPKSIFVGPNSANWNTQMASKALDLESQGVHPKEIWQQTGTFRGPDQKLRQEISDEPSILDMSKVPTQPSLLQLATQYLRDKGIITRPTQDIASGGIPEEARKEAIDFAQKKLFTATPPSVKLQSAFVHPELYGAYPELPQLNLSKETRNDIRGQFNPNLDLVTTGGSETLFTKPDEAKSTLLHELQHAIQSKEGFGRGGNPDIAQSLIQREWSKELDPYYEANAKFNGAISLLKQAGGAQYIHKLDQLSVADNIKPSQIFNISDWYKFGNEIRSELGKMPTRAGFQRDEWLRRAAQMMRKNVVNESPHLEEYASNMNPNEAKNAYQRASRALDKVRPQAQKFNEINAKYKNLSGMEPTEQYKRLSGEAEARATQARMNMTPEERQATFPLESYDVPINELIANNYKKGGSVHMSDNLDTQWAETAFAGGGRVGLAEDAVSLIKGIMEGLGTKEVSKAEAEANKAKFLEPSKEKNVMYHGTFSDFNQFKPSQRGAIFVSPKTDFVNHYIGMYKSDEANKPHIMPVHVNVQNPFDYENPLHLSNLYDEYAQVKGKPLPEKTKQQISEGHWYELENPEVMNLIKSLGHDSMYLTEHNDQNELVKNLGVFDPTQIKSAIGNQGTYDVTNPDITKKRGGPVHMAGGGEFGAIKSMLAEAPELAHTIRGLFTKEAPDLNDLIEKIKTSDRQPVIPMPNRWFTNPEENPQVQPLVEKVLNANNMKREDFHSGAFIDPKTGLILDNQIHKDVGVAIDPLTNRPIMTTGGVTGMESLPKGQGSFTNSNLLKQGKYKPVGGDSILNDLGFIATVDKAGMGHAYGLGTDYASPVLLNNLGTGSNPTLRPRSVGDVFGIGDVVGQMQINRNGPVHDVYEKLLVAPKGSDVQGVKLSKKKGGKVTKHIIDGHEVHVHERML